jgi:hypothetical protein
MAFNYSPKIVTDGLVLYLDAANTKSYPGSGTTWNDLSGNGYDGTLVNGPTFDSESGGNFLLDGVNDYAILSGGATNNTHAWTADDSVGSSILCMELWIKTSDTAGRLISKPWNGSGQYNIQILPSSFYLLAGTTGTTSTTINYNSLATSTWRQLVLWATSTQIGYYIDGGSEQNTISHSITGGVPSSGNSNLPLGLGTLYFYGSGWVGNTSFSINANIAMFRKYNRILSTQEVLQNYNATKTRYGL